MWGKIGICRDYKKELISLRQMELIDAPSYTVISPEP